MSFIKEFREFAVRGNVVDMAVGIIIGAAFGKIVSSLVSDVFMPPIGWLIVGVDFSDLAVARRARAGEDRLRHLYSDGVGFRYRRFCHLYGDQRAEQAEKKATGRGACRRA